MLTGVVDLDGDVNVDPIVDLDIDPRFLDEESVTPERSTCKVDDGVNLYVAVKLKVLGQRRGQPQRLPKAFPAFVLYPLQ
jgi:hypothetical protein